MHEKARNRAIEFYSVDEDDCNDIDTPIYVACSFGVEYMEYIQRIKPNTLAKKVNLADLLHNSDETSNVMETTIIVLYVLFAKMLSGLSVMRL